MHSRNREAVRIGLLRRQIELLEALCEASDAEYESLEQCQNCGEWYQRVSNHEPYCDGA